MLCSCSVRDLLVRACVRACRRVADTSEWQHCDAQHATDPRAIRKLERRQRQNNGHPVVHNTTGASQPRTARSEVIISWRDTLAYSMQQAPANQNDRHGQQCHAVPPASTGNRFEGSPRHPHTVCISCMLKHVRPPAREAAASLHTLRSVHAPRHRSGCSRARSQSSCLFVE